LCATGPPHRSHGLGGAAWRRRLYSSRHHLALQGGEQNLRSGPRRAGFGNCLPQWRHVRTGTRSSGSRYSVLWQSWFPLGSAPPGIRVMVTVRVSAHGQKRLSRVWFTPRQPPPPPAPKPTTAPAPSTGCYPTTSSGNCYKPGEFCPHADAGMNGVAGNGEAIICEDNNGLRWEPG
jgi:hypothetical protein